MRFILPREYCLLNKYAPPPGAVVRARRLGAASIFGSPVNLSETSPWIQMIYKTQRRKLRDTGNLINKLAFLKTTRKRERQWEKCIYLGPLSQKFLRICSAGCTWANWKFLPKARVLINLRFLSLQMKIHIKFQERWVTLMKDSVCATSIRRDPTFTRRFTSDRLASISV